MHKRYVVRFEFKVNFGGIPQLKQPLGPLFTERQDVLPRNLMKFRSCEIEFDIDSIALKFDMHLDNAVAEVSVKF